MMRSILLNPGPVSLSDTVRRAAAATDLCHREPEFFALQDRVREELLAVYGLPQSDWSAVLLGGSGTTALEAMMASLLPRDCKLLVLENGVYGERLSRIAAIHDIDADAVEYAWGEPWDLQQIADALSAGAYTHVAAVHHETTTGRLNSIEQLLTVCEQHAASLLLDGVSSFGAEHIPFTSPALAACAATANKCLHGIPGLCFVLLRKTALGNAATPPRSLTLDLTLWESHQSRQSTPFTPSVNGMLALDQALQELAQSGGWKARHARYSRLAGRVARQLERLGVEALLPEQESSCVLRSYRIPAGRSYADIHDGLKQRGFVVYAGQGSLAEGMFRISTMGDITDYDMDRLETALQDVMAS